MDLSGRITATIRVKGDLPQPLNLTGRIKATVRSEGYAQPLQPQAIPFYGHLAVRVAARLRAIARADLAGRIKATSAARAIAQLPVYGQALALAGRIRATVAARGTTDPRRFLVGRIAAMVKARVGLRGIRLVTGRITATVRAGMRWPLVYLAGNIKTGVKALQAGFPFVYLSGQLRTHTAAHAVIRLTPVINLAGRIAGTSAARLVGNYPAFIGGRIAVASAAQLYQPELTTQLFGATSARSSLRVGDLLPLFELLRSRITIAGRVNLSVSLLEPLPPPLPEPFPTYSTLYYLDRITSEHNQKPRYYATVALSADTYAEEQRLAASLPGVFDLDYSVGEQEDFTGEWIGKSRWIELPTGFFSWDTEGLGWDQANWKGPFDAANSLQRLDDFHYRLLLYAAIIANQWDGSVPGAYEAWDTLFRYTGLRVVIQDYGNMTMLYGLLWDTRPTTVLLSLFTTGQMDLKPEGIELIDYVFPPTASTPLFAWDAESDSVAGWDIGSWGILVPPGTGYVPI